VATEGVEDRTSGATLAQLDITDAGLIDPEGGGNLPLVESTPEPFQTKREWGHHLGCILRV